LTRVPYIVGIASFLNILDQIGKPIRYKNERISVGIAISFFLYPIVS